MKYRMTDEEYNQLLDASKPVPYMIVGGVEPSSPYDNAMRVWARIAERVGCVAGSSRASDTGDNRDFEADPIA